METKARISLAIIEDHPIFRQGIEDVLRLERDFEVVGRASTGEEGLALIRAFRPQLALTDLSLPDLDGVKLVKQVVWERFRTRVVILSAYDDPGQMLQAFCSGVWGYFIKDIQPTELVARLRWVAQGYYVVGDRTLTPAEFKRWLIEYSEIEGKSRQELTAISLPSPREMEVLSHLLLGRSNKQIAVAMGISPQTVKNHLASLFRKLGVKDRTQAVVYALQLGWVSAQSLKVNKNLEGLL
ncbi:MAG: response regulator transcription factor [Anaerolineales bacterium]|nr:response regulator transcription factor [Anaerolineales bacterium]MDW8160861.1 response regulator transcription factor [Anaerolineales bacterium]